MERYDKRKEEFDLGVCKYMKYSSSDDDPTEEIHDVSFSVRSTDDS